MKKLNWPKWPKYTIEDQKAVVAVVKSNQLFAGKNVKKFEDNFKKFTKSKYSIAVGNATQGLHLALDSLNIGLGDEVITTPFSFISTASCILMQNAVPIFVDCEKKTLSPSVKDFEKKINKNTKAIIIVHPFGYSIKIDEVAKLARRKKIFLIEDASHAHGMKYKGVHAGNFGDIGVFSLHQRKSLSVGDGGIIVTKKKKIEEIIKKKRSFGHDTLSYNYRMTEFAGALGIKRLKKLEKENNIRRKNAVFLNSEFKNNSFIKPFRPLKSCLPVYHKYLMLLNTAELNCKLSFFANAIRKRGIPLNIINYNKNWDLLHRHPNFNSKFIARGIPWLNKNYNGKMKKIKFYRRLKFPVIENLIDKHLLELPIDPPVDNKLLKKAVKIIRQEILKFKKKTR